MGFLGGFFIANPGRSRSLVERRLAVRRAGHPWAVFPTEVTVAMRKWRLERDLREDGWLYCLWLNDVLYREMENINRGPTFLFCHCPHRVIDAGRHSCKTTEYKSTDSRLPPLLNVMYCVKVSLWTVKIFLAQRGQSLFISGTVCTK